MLLHGVHIPLFLAFWGLVLGLNLFGAWSCLYLARAGRPRTPGLGLALGLSACASAGVVLFLSSGGGAENLSVLHVLATLPLLLFCLAFVLWFARSPSSCRVGESIRRERPGRIDAGPTQAARRAARMIVSLVGPPLAGKHTLGRALAVGANLAVVDHESIHLTISRRHSAAARRAAALVERGQLVPDELLGSLIHDCIGERDAVLVGYPRTERQLQGMEGCGGTFVLACILLEASREWLDARRAARGLSAVERDHPGALARIASMLAPVLARAEARQSLLRLDAALPMPDLLGAAESFLRNVRGRSTP